VASLVKPRYVPSLVLIYCPSEVPETWMVKVQAAGGVGATRVTEVVSSVVVATRDSTVVRVPVVVVEECSVIVEIIVAVDVERIV